MDALAVVAMHLALARPDLVREVVTIGSTFHFEGTLPELFGDGEPESDVNPLRDDYARVSPDGPEHWSVVNSKIVAMWRSSPQLVEDDLARIDVPFLVLVADDDAVALEHTLAHCGDQNRGIEGALGRSESCAGSSAGSVPSNQGSRFQSGTGGGSSPRGTKTDRRSSPWVWT